MATNNNNHNLAEEVMAKIKKKRVLMLPYLYFVAGSVLLALGILAALAVAALAVSVFSFHFRVMRPMGLSPLFAAGPMFVLSLGILSIVGGAALLKKYDFSYRKSFIGIIAAIVLITAFLGIIIDNFGFDRRPPRPMMRAMYRDIPQGEWLTGVVKDVSENRLLIEQPDQSTTEIVWDKQTKLPPAPLQIGDFVRAIGDRNDGTFRARVIGGGFRPGGMRR